MRKVRIHYYTGTGNTAHAAHRLAEELGAKGAVVELIRVRKGAPAPEAPCDLQVFLFPVYAFSLPGSMKIYLRHFPKTVKGAKAAVIANHGMLNMMGGLNTGYESQSLDEAANALRRKGFDVVFMDKAGYPENITILAHSLKKHTVEDIVGSADRKISEIATRLIAGERKIKKYPFWEKILGVMFGMLLTYLGKWHIGKMYVADRDCNGCGLCAKNCPSHAIRMAGNRPRWNFRCDACLGCYNFCPKTAIQVSLLRVLVMLVITVAIIPVTIAYDHVVLGALFRSMGVFLSSGIFKVLFGIVLYCAIYIVALYVLDKLFFALERIPFLRSLTGWTYTKKIRRYLAPGFEPFKNK